jgi:ADP-heptose:LPS heptosyltransferase
MKRILALQLKRIGDLILTTPALAAMRAQWPEAGISLVVEQGSASLAPALPMVDEVLVFDRKGGNGSLWWKLASRCHDVCLDFTGNDRSALFTFLSRASRRAGFARHCQAGPRAFLYNAPIESSVRDRHTIEHYMDLAAGIGAARGPLDLQLRIPDAALMAARDLLARAGVREGYFILHPGTARMEKQWEPERWAEVAEHASRSLGLPCVITGSDAPVEKAHIREVCEHMSTRPVDLSGMSDLPVLAALISRARCFLGVDSAAMHLASAFNVPQVVLFGPTNPFHWRPLRDNARVLQAGNPEGVFTPRGQGSPMHKIPVETVCAAVDALTSQKLIHSHDGH